MLSKHIEARKL